MSTETVTLPPPVPAVLRELADNEIVAYVGSLEEHHGSVKVLASVRDAVTGENRYVIQTYDEHGEPAEWLAAVRRTSLVAPGDPADHD